MSEGINSGWLGTNLVCKISKENIGNNHTNIIIIIIIIIILFAFQSVQKIYLCDEETQEAIRLMGEATSLSTLPVYLKKIKCCKCAAWLAQNFKANVGNDHTCIIIITIILYTFQSVQKIYLCGKETQEATRLMGQATSLSTLLVYSKKIKCCKCVSWPA